MKLNFSALVSLAFLSFVLAPSAVATKHHSFADIKLTPDVTSESTLRGELRVDAQELADILKVRPYVEMLRTARASGIGDGGTVMPRRLLNAKMLCLFKIVAAQQEVRKVVAIIDYDLAKSNIDLAQLSARRDRTSNMINTLNFMQGGTLGCTKQSLFLNGKFGASQYPLITSFSLGTVLSVINLLHPPLWHRTVDGPHNSLAYFLCDASPPDAANSYLWQFFNSPVPGAKYTFSRREILKRHWHDFARVSLADSHRHRVLAAYPEGSEHMSENIALLSQRIALLNDLRTHVEEFDASLYELHKAIGAN
ncbi:MAG: hypothetical protein JSS86_16925 [Cyanobacteria bacterium SZAS LIN-2]|nr:hypothetical protein [Cyanobacteria bacterium SZAS LIN-2]